MDWMYREHGENEESLRDKKNDYFQHSSIIQDNTFDMGSPSDEKKSTLQTSSEMDAEYSEETSVLGPALSSVHKQISSEMEAEYSEEPSVLGPSLSSVPNFIAEPGSMRPSNEGDVSEFRSDSSDMFFEETDALDKPQSVDVGIPVAKEECNCTSNKDEIIKKLKEEVSFQFLHFSFKICFSWTSLASFPFKRNGEEC